MQSIRITQELEDTFLQELSQQKKNKHEIAEYRRNIDSLKAYAEQYQRILDRDMVQKWREEQIRQGLAKGTVTNRTVRINRFLRFAGAEELCFTRGGRQDLTGKQFGSLIAIEPTGRKSADRSIYWKCRCTACGKEKEIPANQLKRGVQISCGCNRASRLQETNGYVEGTCLKNVLSDKISRNNTSGHKGVYRKRGKWAAKIQYKKKVYYLGSYDRMEDAVDARKMAENWVRDDAEKLLEKIQETG